MAASGAVSACSAAECPRTLRAYSRTACWNPPHVPRNGRDDSRAYRIAASAPSALAYGLAGTHQTAAWPRRASAAGPTAVVCTHSGLTSTPSRPADSRRASGMARCAVTAGSKSPTSATGTMSLIQPPRRRARRSADRGPPVWGRGGQVLPGRGRRAFAFDALFCTIIRIGHRCERVCLRGAVADPCPPCLEEIDMPRSFTLTLLVVALAPRGSRADARPVRWTVGHPLACLAISPDG